MCGCWMRLRNNQDVRHWLRNNDIKMAATDYVIIKMVATDYVIIETSTTDYVCSSLIT